LFRLLVGHAGEVLNRIDEQQGTLVFIREPGRLKKRKFSTGEAGEQLLEVKRGKWRQCLHKL
jgi:hypothetical protein